LIIQVTKYFVDATEHFLYSSPPMKRFSTAAISNTLVLRSATTRRFEISSLLGLQTSWGHRFFGSAKAETVDKVPNKRADPLARLEAEKALALKFRSQCAKAAARKLEKDGKLNTKGWEASDYKEWYTNVLMEKLKNKEEPKVRTARQYFEKKLKDGKIQLDFDPKNVDKETLIARHEQEKKKKLRTARQKREYSNDEEGRKLKLKAALSYVKRVEKYYNVKPEFDVDKVDNETLFAWVDQQKKRSAQRTKSKAAGKA